MVGREEPLEGRTVFVPRMCAGASELCAAAFRGLGFASQACPEGDAAGWEQALRSTSGDECYPQRVVLADFLTALASSGVEPSQAALFLTTGRGPCRFGQYAPFLARSLGRMGLGDVLVLAPDSDSGYRGVMQYGRALKRLIWRGVLASDTLRDALHRTRPYELRPGDADRAYDESLRDACAALEAGPRRGGLELLADALRRGRERFRAVPAEAVRDRPVIGVVGEIFCRLNTFSNDEVVRTIERLGGEVRLSGIGEWVWYANACELSNLRRSGSLISRTGFAASVSWLAQKREEAKLLEAVHDGPEEPDVRELVELARPYLPWEGALGEMVLSVGKAVYHQRTGADGVVDVSPFGCMNGIVSEAVYPKLSRENGGIPIRVFYVDRATNDLAYGLEIFLELAANYRRARKRQAA
ncbi:MAG: hypothetical protein HY900_12510 [Deltaproteobacteria bacterium]|nr:hypothetical protein [Deltaproteobacteria bacterium]